MRLKSGNDFVFQQDGAPAHRSRHTVEFLNSKVPEFVEPHNWPPNSPDLNPVDYSIWSALQQRVYLERIVNVEHLKRVTIRCWTEISSMEPSTNGHVALMQLFELVEDTLNIYLIKNSWIF